MFAGEIRQPKWGHLRDLHAALKLCEPALVAVDTVPPSLSLGSMQEVSRHISNYLIQLEMFYNWTMAHRKGEDWWMSALATWRIK